jgi:cell wall-associated NlpC family hydrolase
MGNLFLAALLAAGTAVVTRPVANMYSSATVDTDVVSQAILGTNVQILEEKNGWVKIRTPDDYTGWMELAALKASDKPYGASGRVAQVESLFAHLYRTASVTRLAPLLTAPYETRLEVVAEPAENEGRWIQVRLPDDRAAWVQRGDVTFEPKTMTIPELIAHARRFLGLPYTWGGTSSFGYDCSGFVQMLCRRRGVMLPRDADPQSKWKGLKPVEKAELQPGDLLYFGSAKRITHTGMYIGDGEFIDFTTYQTPMGRIDRLDEDHWTRLFVCARRLK